MSYNDLRGKELEISALSSGEINLLNSAIDYLEMEIKSVIVLVP